MAEYCEKCGGEILNINDKNALGRAMCQALLMDSGTHVLPKPTYCRCNENLPPLVLGEAEDDH